MGPALVSALETGPTPWPRALMSSTTPRDGPLASSPGQGRKKKLGCRMQHDDERERELMGLEMILGGLRQGLAIMPEACDSARSFSSLPAYVEERLADLGSPAEPRRRAARRFRRDPR